MENDIWNEISSFLNQLRCENINRESYIYFQELANIVNTDELVHTARSSSACFPVFQCTLSAA